ncbi:dihydrodipicolinate synthase family protein [Arthrobacter sp. S2(2024)]|uniref:dihydrodipicolinate synthase family protein n=1 Tax=Arthrobacter sp. S2(2024) TaxID=3111911 RepID=UPI002FC5D12A
MSNQYLAPGVWGVIATPFLDRDLAVDTTSLDHLARHYESIGATGLTVLGVFGEAASLTLSERALVLETVSNATSLPQVVGVTALSTQAAIDEILAAQAVSGMRFAAAMIQVNSSIPKVVTDHLQTIRRDTGAAIVLQDYPAATGVTIKPADLIDVVKACDFIAAVKAENAPTSAAISTISPQIEAPIFGGLGGQGLLDELLAGAAGAMTGFSYPEALIACIQAWHEEGYEAARDALLPYLPLINFEQQPRIALAIRKECLHNRGLINRPHVRQPAATFPEGLRSSMLRHLQEVPQVQLESH